MTAMKFKIESGIAIPEPQMRSKTKYPFPQMEVGDSFVVEKSKKQATYSAAYSYGARHGGHYHTLQTDENGVLRCWRTK